MTKKQLHEEHTRLITDFRQPRIKVTVKPYSYSHFRTLVEKDYTQKDIETITSMYVMQQLQESVVVDMPAPELKETRYCSPITLERETEVKEENTLSKFKKEVEKKQKEIELLEKQKDLLNVKRLLQNLVKESPKPRWKFW